jgi:hypothetical protein
VSDYLQSLTWICFAVIGMAGCAGALQKGSLAGALGCVILFCVSVIFAWDKWP